MLNKPQPQPGTPHPAIYRIRIQGQLDNQWMDWFSGMDITLEEDGVTVLTGPVVDQAALHGLLKKIRDLGMPLISVNRVQANEIHPHQSKEGDKK